MKIKIWFISIWLLAYSIYPQYFSLHTFFKNRENDACIIRSHFPPITLSECFPYWVFFEMKMFNGYIISPCIVLHNEPNIALYRWFLVLAVFGCSDNLYIHLWKRGSLVARDRHPPWVIGSRIGEFRSSQFQPQKGQRWVISGRETWVQRLQPPVGLPSQCPAFSLGIGFIFLVLSTGTSGQFAGDGGAVLHVAGRIASMAPPGKSSGPSVMLAISHSVTHVPFPGIKHSCRSCCDRESPSWSLNPHLHPSREGLLFSPDEGPLLWWVFVWGVYKDGVRVGNSSLYG